MPLSKVGDKILSKMEKAYKDPKKAKQVLYAMENAGKLTKKTTKKK